MAIIIFTETQFDLSYYLVYIDISCGQLVGDSRSAFELLFPSHNGTTAPYVVVCRPRHARYINVSKSVTIIFPRIKLAVVQIIIFSLSNSIVRICALLISANVWVISYLH